MATNDAREDLVVLLEHLRRFRFPSMHEAGMGRHLSMALDEGGFQYVREFVLASGGRLDFYFPATRLFIECKVAQSWATVMRQMERYCEAPETSGGLLFSRRNAHRFAPDALNGKPLASLWVGGFVN